MRGGRRENAGRKKGTPNRRTLEWSKLGQRLLTHGTARAQRIMDKADDEKFMGYFFELLRYFKARPRDVLDVTIHNDEVEQWLKMSREELAQQIRRAESENKLRTKYENQGAANAD